MTRIGNQSVHGPGKSVFFCTVVALAISLCLVGCARAPWEITVNSPRYDVARGLWVIGRMHAGDEVSAIFQSSYEALFKRATEVLSDDELDQIAAAFADMQLEDVYGLLAGFDPRNDKWLEPGGGASSSDPAQIQLMRSAWDRFLKDWDTGHWRAQRESDLTGFARDWPYTDEPFALVPRWFDAPLPEPHVLFYMPAALGTHTYLLRVDAGYAMVGGVGRARRTPDIAGYVIETNWLRDLSQEEEDVLRALAERSDTLETIENTRECIIHILYQAARDGSGLMDGMMEHAEEVWAENGWPGLVAALDERIDAAWSAGKKLTEQDVWSVLKTWLAEAGD